MHRKKIDTNALIFDVTISSTSKSQVLRKIGLQRREMLHIATVNPEFIMEAKVNPYFRKVLGKTLNIADGWGVVWAARILGRGKIERISGAMLANLIVEKAANVGECVFLLGAKTGVAERAAANLSKIYPQLKLAWYEGAQTVKVEKSEEASMTIAKINAFEPDYLLVAYGSPWQDIWIEDNRPYLRVRVAMGVGGVLDEWAGVVKICPEWLDRAGGKWLWRVAHEPWRLKRILKVMEFGLLVIIQRLGRIVINNRY